MTPAKKVAAETGTDHINDAAHLDVVEQVSEAPAPVRKPWTLASVGPVPLVTHAPAHPAVHGFVGQQVDETPNEHYTVAGQLAAMPEKG